MNIYNGRPYSDRFHEILKKRLQLPVWEYRKDFMETALKHQVIVLVGETGSGKTTQVCVYAVCFISDNFPVPVNMLKSSEALPNNTVIMFCYQISKLSQNIICHSKNLSIMECVTGPLPPQSPTTCLLLSLKPTNLFLFLELFNILFLPFVGAFGIVLRTLPEHYTLEIVTQNW